MLYSWGPLCDLESWLWPWIFAIGNFVAVQATIEQKTAFQFSHAGHVTEFLNFSRLSTDWERHSSGGGAVGGSDCATVHGK